MDKLFNRIVAAFFVGVLAGALIYTPDCSAYLKTEKVGESRVWVLYDRVSLDVFNYFPLIVALGTAQEGKTIRIIVRDNRGGAVSSMTMINKAIKYSKAKVVTILQGYAASAGAHILMQGDEIIIPPKGRLLWHTGSLVTGDGVRIRLTPYDERISSYYMRSIREQRFLYPAAVQRCIRNLCTPGGQLIIDLNSNKAVFNLDGNYRYVSKEYWDLFLTGADKWETGATVCKWNLSQIPARDSREHYIGKGCKLTGVKGQLQ